MDSPEANRQRLFDLGDCVGRALVSVILNVAVGDGYTILGGTLHEITLPLVAIQLDFRHGLEERHPVLRNSGTAHLLVERLSLIGGEELPSRRSGTVQ